MPSFRRKPAPEPELLAPDQIEPDPASGPYKGRLAFDPDSGFHLAETGEKVVTHDEGKSWHYAQEGDKSHLERYQRQVKTIDSTSNKHAELALEHGEPRASELIEPHHHAVQSQDAHYNGIVFTPDMDAPFETGHTEAYK